MSVKSLIKFFLGCFIVFCGFTRTLSPVGSGVLGRITVSDLFALSGLILFAFMAKRINKSIIAQSSILLVACFSFGLVVSASPSGTFVELLIHLYLVITFIIIISVFTNEEDLKHLIVLFGLSALIVSFIGIFDTVAMNVGAPRIMPGRKIGEANSTFRNAGQAGAYILVILSFFIPLSYSSYMPNTSKRFRLFIKGIIVLSLIFLLITGKVAAYIGFGIGLILFIVLRLKLKLGLIVSASAILLVSSFSFIQVFIPDTFGRIDRKIQARLVRNLDGSKDITEEGFFASNFKAAIAAFKDNPSSGSGLGGINSGGYHSHEIHSTYFKLIGETGLLGVVSYLIFFSLIFLMFYKVKNNGFNKYYHLLFLILPFLIADFISWGYTYHLRKREFWILLSLVYIIRRLGDKQKNKSKALNYG